MQIVASPATLDHCSRPSRPSGREGVLAFSTQKRKAIKMMHRKPEVVSLGSVVIVIESTYIKGFGVLANAYLIICPAYDLDE